MPAPREMLPRIQASPVPAHTTFRSIGSTASEPMDATGCPSKTGSQVPPPSEVLKTPPDAAPA